MYVLGRSLFRSLAPLTCLHTTYSALLALLASSAALTHSLALLLTHSLPSSWDTRTVNDWCWDIRLFWTKVRFHPVFSQGASHHLEFLYRFSSGMPPGPVSYSDSCSVSVSVCTTNYNYVSICVFVSVFISVSDSCSVSVSAFDFFSVLLSLTVSKSQNPFHFLFQILAVFLSLPQSLWAPVSISASVTASSSGSGSVSACSFLFFFSRKPPLFFSLFVYSVSCSADYCHLNFKIFLEDNCTLVYSFVNSHCSLFRFLRTAPFACALCCIHL